MDGVAEGAHTVRAARPDELARLQDVERAADSRFAGIGMPEVGATGPASVDTLAGYLRAGRLWVVTDGTDAPVGSAFVDVVDSRAHLEQLSVHPAHGRRGLGRQLVEHVCAWARREDHDAVTLVTFAEVAWNAPFYERCGFRVMADHELGPELREVWRADALRRSDPSSRVCMVRSLGA